MQDSQEQSQNQKSNINWYPGHMHKARGELKKVAPQVDLVIELLDARIPNASRNPYLPKEIKAKPHIFLLTKIDLADAQLTKQWQEHLRNMPNCLDAFAINNKDTKTLTPVQKKLEQIASGKKLKKVTALVIGVPNLGKSSFINNLAGRKVAKTANQPGVTRGQNFIKINNHINLLDTPGILWGKFDTEQTAELLAINSIIKETRFEDIDVALSAIEILKRQQTWLLEKMQLDAQNSEIEILEDFARKNGCLIKGGDLNLDKAALILLNNLRTAKYGGITWESP